MENNIRPRLAIDCDGVVANCEKFIIEHFGQPYRELGGDYVWKHLTKEIPNIFYQFEVLPNVNYLLDEIKHFEETHDIFFLTAIPDPTGYLLSSAIDKERWVRDKLGSNYPVHCTLGRHLKHKYVYSPDDILIDDHSENIREWVEAGGIGVHHTDVWKTIHRLDQLKYVYC